MGNICLICCFLTRLGLTVTFHWSHCVSSQIHRQVFSTPSITRWSWGAWIHKVSTLQEAINSSIQCCGVLQTNRFLHHVVGPRRKAKCLYLFWTIKSGELSQVVMKTNTQIPKEREHGVKMTQVNIVFLQSCVSQSGETRAILARERPSSSRMLLSYAIMILSPVTNEPVESFKQVFQSFAARVQTCLNRVAAITFRLTDQRKH